EDFAVECYPQGAVPVTHGLPSTGEVEDAQAHMPESRRLLGCQPLRIGTAVLKHGEHVGQHVSFGSQSVGANDPCNPTHEGMSTSGGVQDGPTRRSDPLGRSMKSSLRAQAVNFGQSDITPPRDAQRWPRTGTNEHPRRAGRTRARLAVDTVGHEDVYFV